MTDQTEPTVDSINAAIIEAFKHIYPSRGSDEIYVHHLPDETIRVDIEDEPSYIAVIHSDDDGYLRFGLYDSDYADEFPDEDPTEFLMIRVKVL